MRLISNLLLIMGLVTVCFVFYSILEGKQVEKESLNKALSLLDSHSKEDLRNEQELFSANQHEVIGILDIPKLERMLPIVEGTDDESLDRGVGHYVTTVFPGQGEQILLSGHRDTVFRDFGKLQVGDYFIVNMPYGSFTYAIQETVVVEADDTSVIRKMGEEVLVISTCYPFNYVGNAPKRFVAYAYPLE